MNTRGLLDQLLGAGKSLLGQAGITDPGGQVTDFGKGAATGGVLGLLLGSKTGRKLATYGGLAALGIMAWRAYNGKQPDSGDTPPPGALSHTPARDRALLRAMLAASRVDGHIDDRERALIDAEVVRLGGDADLRGWLETELRRPLDPQSIADEAHGNELLASELYLASALMIAEVDFLERAYLDRLGECLGLEPWLRQRLEREALDGAADSRAVREPVSG